MKTTPVVFYFSFDLSYFEDYMPQPYPIADECTVGIIRGSVDTQYAEKLQKDLDNQDDWHMNITETLEGEYGVHDWSSGPCDDVICLGGYCSYEVEPDLIPTLMKRWREELLKSCPYPLTLEEPRYLAGDHAFSDEEMLDAYETAQPLP